jgi:hypothetical protein
MSVSIEFVLKRKRLNKGERGGKEILKGILVL